ncbi:MAG: outer membrane protein assembly factor BamE [Pseudomonadota bacterium]
MVRYVLLAAVLLLGGCNFIYKIDIQQGNVLDQRLVDELRPGMTKRQVSLILGTPAINSPFRQDRWDYISTFDRRGERITRTVLTLSFEEDRLVRIEGDMKPAGAEISGDGDGDDDAEA